ncbi:hypothetical protein BDQ17DRAFT_1241175 [Cyathus striatus]|nr:hypothetical protein BDQ17DRAFT_1241175 [Cyathus striatus]
MDDLTSQQQAALTQLRELTNGGDDDVAVSVLRSVDWDVQRAADFIFGNVSSSAPAPSSSRSQIEPFQVDDSHQGEESEALLGNDSPRPPTLSSTIFQLARPVFSVLSLPLQILTGVVRFLFGLLRIPFPRFSGLTFRPQRIGRPTDHGGPDRWLRELEEETGAISIGRLRQRTSGSTASGINAGPSNLVARNAATDSFGEDGHKLLPDFRLGSYEETIRLCQREHKIACIILVAEEHDDTAEFKRSTLTDPNFVKTLYDNDIVVWGGDVRNREAWSASEKLQATTYPFIAFVALQPRRIPSRSSSSSSTPVMTVLSRHQGPSVPASEPTSAQTLTEHLTRQVIPRVRPFLERLKNTERDRQRERELREEQDRAFRESARRDRERIERKMREEREEQERRKAVEEEERQEQEVREYERLEREREEERRMVWRRWLRGVVSQQPNGKLRIAIRLPEGGRIIHAFAPGATLTTLYAVVDAQLIPSHISAAEDPSQPPHTVISETPERTVEEHLKNVSSTSKWWGFLVVSAYPRKEIPWIAGVQLEDIPELRGGGQVAVEMLSNGGRKSGESRRSMEGSNGYTNASSDSDGYSTEESE